jgi:hypothetical protein
VKIADTLINTVLPESFMQHVSHHKSVHKLVRTVYPALRRFAASPARQQWMTQAQICRKAAFENEFFTDDEKKEMRTAGQEPHVVNKLVSGIQGASAIATANRPDIKVFPLRESDPYLAELIKNALEHVWLKNYGSDVVYDCVEERNVAGIGCIEADIDENKGPYGAVVFQEGDPDLWYWDEESKKRDRSDTHLIKAQLRSVKYIIDHYPELKQEDIVSVNDKFESSPQSPTDTSTDGTDNYKRGATGHEPNPEEGKRMVWEVDAWLIRVEHEHWATVIIDGTPQVVRFGDAKSKSDAEVLMEEIRELGIQLQPDTPLVPVEDITYWPRTLHNRYKVRIVGDKVIPQPDPQSDEKVDETRNPLGLDSDGDPVLPVVFYYAQRTGKKAYYRSPTYYAFDPNKSLCKREVQYTFAVSKSQTAPVVREEQGTRWLDPKRPDRPGNELLISKTSRFPQRLDVGQVDLTALTARIMEDKTNIDEAYGLPEVLKGKVPQGLERMSGRLGLALQDTGTIMQNPAIRGLESCLEALGKTLLALILLSWPRFKWESLVTEDRINEFRPHQDPMNAEPDENKGEELKMQEKAERQKKWSNAIDKVAAQGMSVVDFNVAITAGSSLPTNRLLKEETAIEKYKIGLFDRQAALEYSGEPHAKEIAARMDKREMQLAQAGVKPKKG